MTSLTSLKKPDIKISVKQTFGLDTEMEIEAFSKTNEFVPKIDQKSYFFVFLILIGIFKYLKSNSE